ncbi:FtsB family cell division protein [Clostridium frigidicarnis]|uniref:Cell division protein FtsL n=1 Tax=Clostridium frigidicarnis TaxID=84698 RepID=A0A1I0YNY3_9CLOT|nr:septum formation initiator family protein [Clostridium frigidicarnis]SFB14170.1 cell division protein FtsL [Clostridium frigidicarnis]
MKKRLTLKNIIIALLIAYSVISVVNQQVKVNQIKKEMSKEETELDTLKEKNQKLQDEVDLSKTDLYIEKMARERLGYVKGNEIPVINNKTQ